MYRPTYGHTCRCAKREQIRAEIEIEKTPDYHARGMTIEKIRSLHDARPFRPFTIHLADGRNVRVEHPEFMSRSPSGRTIYVEKPGDVGHHIDLLLVTDLVPDNGRRP